MDMLEYCSFLYNKHFLKTHPHLEIIISTSSIIFEKAEKIYHLSSIYLYHNTKNDKRVMVLQMNLITNHKHQSSSPYFWIFYWDTNLYLYFYLSIPFYLFRTSLWVDWRLEKEMLLHSTYWIICILFFRRSFLTLLPICIPPLQSIISFLLYCQVHLSSYFFNQEGIELVPSWKDFGLNWILCVGFRITLVLYLYFEFSI